MRFWEDSWANNTNLKVGEVGIWVDSVWVWKLRWRRPGFECESTLQEELLRSLSGVKLNREMKDCMTWKGEDFSVKSAYDCVAKSDICNENVTFKHLWMSRAFPNVLTTGWRVLLDRIPTRVNLSRRGVVVDTTLCALCQKKWPESSQHMFLEREYAQQVWTRCYRCIGILYVQYKTLRDHFKNFILVHVNFKHNLVWKGVWAAIIWSIWDQRNRIAFKLGRVDTEEILHMAQLKTWL